jgi:hypothetical protein
MDTVSRSFLVRAFLGARKHNNIGRTLVFMQINTFYMFFCAYSMLCVDMPRCNSVLFCTENIVSILLAVQSTHCMALVCVQTKTRKCQLISSEKA